MHSRARRNEAPPIVMLTYGVSSTTIMYGLPRQKQEELLAKYRARHAKTQTRLLRAKAKSRGIKERPVPNMKAYDMCCEYYSQVYEMQTASSAALNEAAEAYESDSDTHSVSVASSIPSLEPTLPPSHIPCPVCSDRTTADTESAVNTDTAVQTPNAVLTTHTGNIGTDTTNAEQGNIDAPSLQSGESYQMPEFPPESIHSIRSINSDGSYTLYTLPVANLPESLQNSPDAADFTKFTYREHLDGEGMETVWALLNEVNRLEYPGATGSAGRQDWAEDYPKSRHRLKILGRTGTRYVSCRCRNQKHSAYKRHQAYAFPDGHGNIVIKKSQCLLLALP
ncbi:hypothetical protein C8F04DRAFT_1270122 [Mycena alexandri]|uniref:Uncharacterized protein n=1 Tax=Mycena alexandri TaxID=1745969 RepID=A0AAD6SFM2_9AGAR|nr:hypothetical protein C8F04DRAFT_1270122 [Mycena alexandri]